MRHRRALAVAAACLGLGALAPTASAQLDEVNTKRLRDGVTVNGILQHERAFQFIANLNGGTRASGTPGYDASADYVARRLEAAGYEVTRQEFEFPFFRELAPSELELVAPTARTFANGTDFLTMRYSGPGDATGPLVAVDVPTPPVDAPGSTSGCEAADFAGFPAGAIALVQRGTCPFALKATNAQAAGAAGVVVFNAGAGDPALVLNGTLGGPGITIPVLGTSFAIGQELLAAAQAGATARVAAFTESETRTTSNVLADTDEGDASQLVVVGAHLDSVVEGPGINDNGSGTAAILETAEELAELDPRERRKLRFAFWGAEESGLLGSRYYVQNATPEQVADHYANLNFDMVGSPNYVRFVYDGDNSLGDPTAGVGPAGSDEIERLFTRFFAGQGLESDESPFTGRSDYGPFIAAGIPAGGLFTGAEGIKTEAQAAVYGGQAGVAYDPCYHQACDTINNVNTRALSEMSDAIAHAVLTLARSRGGLHEDGSRRGQARRMAFRGDAALR